METFPTSSCVCGGIIQFPSTITFRVNNDKDKYGQKTRMLFPTIHELNLYNMKMYLV